MPLKELDSVPGVASRRQGQGAHNFHHFAIQFRGKKQFLLSQIGNTDQTAINIDMPRSTRVKTKGAKSVCVQTTGAYEQLGSAG